MTQLSYPGYIPKGPQILLLKYLYIYVTAVAFTMAETESARHLADEWTMKMWYIYIQVSSEGKPNDAT